MKIKIIIIALILCLNISINAQPTAIGLDIAENAYEKNIGYGGVALYNDIGGISCNPSIIPNIESLSGTFTYIDYIYDFNMIYGNFLYPDLYGYNLLGKFGYFYMPSISDIETGEELSYYELFLGAGTGYHFLNKKLSTGAILNFYTANIAGEQGVTVFLDLGASYPFILPLIKQHKIILGLSMLNLGAGIKYIDESSPLPLNINLGFQYIYNSNYKLFGGIRKYTAYKGSLYSLGGEIIIANALFLRASMIEEINNNLKYNIGIGFNVNYTGYHFLIDYVFLPMEIAPETASLITLSFKFPVPGQEEENIRKDKKNWKNLWTSE